MSSLALSDARRDRLPGDRHVRRVRLTDAGLLLLRRAQDILDMADKTQAEFRAYDAGMGGVVSVGSPESDSFKYFARAVKRVQSRCPRIRFDVLSGDSVTINPRMLGTLTWAKGSCITAGKHRVSSEWHIDNGVLRLNVTADKYLLDNHYITIDEKNITNLCHEHNLRFSYSMGAE